MSWNYERSSKRIKEHLDGMGKIEIEKLSTKADLDALLSETKCREIFGAHIYVDVPNFAPLATRATEDETDLRRLARGLHIYQREVSRIVEHESMFDGFRVHFQGAKLHALFYRPIDDERKIASRALLLQMVLRDFVREVFNPAFTKLGNFRVAGGADIGHVIGTKNGMAGDRELLFLGAPANYAAKIIGSSGTIRATQELYDAIPRPLKAYCEVSDDTDHNGARLYDVGDMESDDLVALCNEYDVEWDPYASADRIDKDKEQFPLSGISIEDAEVLIDIDALSINKNKLVEAASLFADVAGFTSYIDSSETPDDKKRALRVFHAIRRELSRVVRHDFSGLRIQFQGDRVQAIHHLPKGDVSAIVTKAVETAVGLQSSMTYTLPEHVPEAKSLLLAIGIDVGDTLVSKTGTRGHRDRICIGAAVEEAARCEERHCGNQIALTTRAYEALPTELQECFTRDRETGDYIAIGLTAEKLNRVASASRFASAQVHVKAGLAGATVSSRGSEDSRAIHPTSSWRS